MTKFEIRNKHQLPTTNWKIGLLVFILSLAFGCWSFPATAQQYPQLDIQGYKKWEFRKVEVAPQANYFAGLSQIGGFSPTVSGGPWQERLQLKIIGKLSKELSVSYDLDQQPETPEKFDVKVTYDNRENAAAPAAGAGAGLGMAGFNELTFGDLTASFSGNEFASAAKNLNGVMLGSKTSWYDVLVVPSAKLKSQTQSLTVQRGNNTSGPYNLGHGSIVEGSERIELNNIPLQRNVDYTIDYFEGKISFKNRILTASDEFKYSFEYTNIIDIFFPTLSKRDFFGTQARFTINPEEFGKTLAEKKASTIDAQEIFPTAGSQEGWAFETEEVGQYQLGENPIVEFSEHLTFMGTSLHKDEDYIIRYSEGTIKLLTRYLPTAEDPLTVAYQYYQASAESESVAGQDSRGPYKLLHANLVPGSEQIEVDSKLVVRDLDYALNNETGNIMFGQTIGRASEIKASYQYKVMTEVKSESKARTKELKVGITYLKESAKQSEASATATATQYISGATIIDNDYFINLSNRPLSGEASADVTLSIAGVALSPEVDYIVPGNLQTSPEAKLQYISDRSDPSTGFYTGTIKFLNTAILSRETSVAVSYTYYKSIVSSYSDSGNTTRGPYSLQNIRNIVPGSETVQVRNVNSSVITTYDRNSSPEVSAGSNGYSINYNQNTPTVTFNEALSSDQRFMIIFQYVPPSAFKGDNLSQSVYGLDGSFSLGEAFKVNSAYAKSETDQVFAAVSTVEPTLKGDGTKTLVLHSPQNIIEGSEIVTVNSRVINRDIDYFITYTKPGQLQFFYITPTSQDALAVEYKYQSTDPADGFIAGQTVKAGAAYRLGAETKLFGEKLIVSGNTKQVDSTFNPMGGTSIGLGSQYKEYGVKYQPGWNALVSNYSYKENNNPISGSSSRFLRSYDNALTLGLNPRGLAQVDFNIREYRAADDQTPGITHESDSKIFSYGLSLTPQEVRRGWVGLTTKYDLKKDVSETDALDDNKRKTESATDYHHLNAALKVASRVDLSFDYQQSEPKTIARQFSTTEVRSISTHTRARDTAYRFSLDLTPAFLKKLTTSANLLNQENATLVRSFASTDEVLTTKNETYHVDLIPVQILSISADHSLQERTTLVVGGSNPKTESNAARAALTPFAWLSAGWNTSRNESIPDSGRAFRTAGDGNTYDLAWSPISLPRFKFASKFVLSNRNQTAPSGSAEVLTETDSLAKDFSIDLLPVPNIPVKLGLNIEEYANKNTNLTSPIDTQTQNETQSLGVIITPTPSLTISSSYNKKKTKVLRDLNPSLAGQERAKTIFDNKATYQLFSWGTLVYSQTAEKNNGEIQSGSVAVIDIEKTTQAFSLNINFPVDNPVLSSFVFIASMKTVDYKNLNPARNGADDFVASQMSFEGSLNF